MIQSFLQYIRYEKNYSSHTVLSYQTDIEQLRDFIITQKGGFDPKNLTSDNAFSIKKRITQKRKL